VFLGVFISKTRKAPRDEGRINQIGHSNPPGLLCSSHLGGESALYPSHGTDTWLSLRGPGNHHGGSLPTGGKRGEDRMASDGRTGPCPPLNRNLER